MENGSLIAALDLGSNSFRLEIGRYFEGHIERSEYYKETVRQGSGLDTQGFLSEEAMQRGWDCLQRFSERLISIAPQQIRAVATQTLREAKNRDEFLAGAKEILGFSVDVISGREEARLIYQGVAHLLPQSDERRLVVDIGGRSTECILGRGLHSHNLDSYRLGSVSWSQRFFPGGRFTASAFKEAKVAAQALLEEGAQWFSSSQWDVAYGASGSIGAVAEVLHAQFQTENRISREALDWVQERLLKSKTTDKISLPALKDDRRAVIAGGLCVLQALMQTFGIENLYAAQGALRQGVLFDMLSRESWATDTRAQSAQRMAKRCGVDTEQAERVRLVAQYFFKMQLEANKEKWLRRSDSRSEMDLIAERVARKLDWAAQVHEVGTIISHNNHHKHGAYILQNADAPGFSYPELYRVSQLVLGQRGKLRKIDTNLFQDSVFQAQLISLRLAIILCHARVMPIINTLELQSKKSNYVLSLPTAWASQFPQSVHLLEQECLAWQKEGVTVQLLRV